MSASSDWTFCKDSLLKLSRTFAVPIAMLEDELERVVTCGYLLCRIADTVEDHATVPLRQRDELYARLLEVIEHGDPAEVFEDAYRRICGDDDDEGILAVGLGRVLAVLGEAAPEAQDICKRWVAELTRGMAIYSHRRPGPDGVMALASIEDLERYCYFVAGTVGQMLTELFLWSMGGGARIGAERDLIMRQHAESFGAGLQLVNIIKDMSEDLGRQVSFIPRLSWRQQGIEPSQILEPQHRPAAHRAITPVFEHAARHLDDAFTYALAIPARHRDIRLFCLVPLWLAVATLRTCRGNDDLFVAGRKVKITRDEVSALVAECTTLCEDDAALRDAYRRLTRGPAVASAPLAHAVS